ncbi:MAG: hypothetical protein KDA80_21385 [Planctomycetaceae bacterium]|nr:hypothetical protein [Planctomycetaceae bacterium]
MFRREILGLVILSFGSVALAGVGDPQIQTDHPWYPGELSCSTFERLQTTQANLFERELGRPVKTDQDRALAAWMWRNLNYAHGEEGKENLWGEGFTSGDTTTREYWTGLFAHGFGLCGTTHAQWTAELNALLGHGRGRTVGVTGHNACEVFLTGGPYGDGQWALLDHDVSTVVFDSSGSRLLSIQEIGDDLTRWTNPDFLPDRQHGWPLGGLHPDDPQAYREFRVVEHLPGYAGPPPMINLRAGETLRRYFQPGLEDGQTYVYWGRNYHTAGIPGPERSRTWVNQPERFIGSSEGAGFSPGRARFGNAVYTYRPSFHTGRYREGVISENSQQVTFEFQTPFIIAATPPDDSDWGIYKPGCRNGLVVRTHETADFPVEVTVDRGRTWSKHRFINGMVDLTDQVKGSRQYWIRCGDSAKNLRNAELEIVTVCQANPQTFPRLKDNGSEITYASSERAVVSAGPTLPQARVHVVEGSFNSPRVTLELSPPREGSATHVYAAAHVASSNPPNSDVRYQIDCSLDRGITWKPLVSDWRIVRRGNEPNDFWSQSFCYGDCSLPPKTRGPVQVRFHNNGGKRYLRGEMHLAYRVADPQPCRVTFHWSDSQQNGRTASHSFDSQGTNVWHVATSDGVQMHWVEFAPETR